MLEGKWWAYLCALIEKEMRPSAAFSSVGVRSPAITSLLPYTTHTHIYTIYTYISDVMRRRLQH